MNESRAQESSGRTSNRRHEPRDLSVAAVALFALGLLLMLVAVHFGMEGLFHSLRRKAERSDALPSILADPRPMPSAPRLEELPGHDLETVQSADRVNLESYGWIDRSRGIVRIPIDRALDLAAERGFQAGKDH